MSDKLVVEIDSKDAEVAMRNLDRLTTAAEQMGKAFENTKGATSALRELRLMLTGIKGQGSSLDELKNSIQSLNSTADSLKRSFAGSVGQLGRIFKNEMAELKSIVQETGLGVGRAAVKGIEDGMAEAPAAIRKQGRTIAAAAKAEATRVYEAMVAGQASAKIKDVGALFKLDEAGATLSPYHKQVLENWKKSSAETFRAMKAQLATEREQLEGQVKAENEALQSALKRMEGESKTRNASLTSIYRSSLARGNSSISQVRTALKAEAAQLQATVKSENDALQTALQSMESNSRDKAKSLAAIYRDSLGRGNFAMAQVKSKLKAESSELQAAVKAEESELQRALQAMEASDKLRKSSLAEIYAGSLKRGDQGIARVKAQLREQADNIIQANKTELARVQAQVAAATNNAGGLYQKYNASTQRPGAITNPNKIPDVSKSLPKPAEIDAVANSFKRLTIDGNDAHSMARGLASGFNLLWLTWGNLVPLFAGAAISNGFMQTIKLGMQVGHTFQTIASLGEVSAEGVAMLRTQLYEIGQSGPYGPEQVAEAMKTLALAGLQLNEILAVTPTVLNFALAGTTSITQAADVLVSVTSAFGTGAAGFEESADIITRSAADSKASVESFGEAMKTASVVGELYGAAQRDVALMIQYLSQVGIQGTSAGTAVRNAMADISGRSGQAQRILKSLGAEFKQSTGEVIPFIDQMRELNRITKDYDAVSQKNIINAIYGERGSKVAAVGLQAFNTAAKDASKYSNKLEEDLARLEDAAGDSAIASAQMAQSTQKAFEAVAATAKTALVEAFDAIEPQMYLVADALRKAFSSDEAKEGLRTLVTAVADLAMVVAKNLSTIVEYGLAWAAFKVAVFGVNAIVTAATALLGLYTNAKIKDTAATIAQTGAEAALSKTIDSKKTATLTSGAAALSMGTKLLGVLPIVGNAVLLGSLAWDLYKSSVDGAGKTVDNYVDTKADNIITALENETRHIREVNELRAQGLTLMEAEARVKFSNSKSEMLSASEAKIETAEAEIRRLRTVNASYNNPTDVSYGLLARKENTAKILALEAEISKARSEQGTNTLRMTLAENERKEAAQETLRLTRLEQEAAKKATVTGTKTWSLDEFQGGGKGFGGPREFYEAQKTAFDKSIQEIEKRGKVEVEKLQSIAADKKAILDSEQQAGLISTEEYNSQLMVLLKSSEDAQIAEIRKTSQDFRAEYDKRHRTISDLIAKAEATSAKGKGASAAKAANLKELRAELSTLEELGVTSSERWASAIDKLTSRYDKDLQVAINKNLGSLKKLREEDDKFWKDQTDELAKAKALEAVNQQYANINESVFSLDEANKAYALAFADSASKSEAYIGKLSTELETAQYAAEEFWHAAMADGEFSDTDSSGYISYLKKIQGLEELIIEARAKGATLADDAGNLAFDRKRREQNTKLANDLSDAVMTGLFDGAEAGKKKLRDVLVAELRKPIKMVVDLTMNAAVNGTMNSLGLGGGAGGGGGGGGASILGNAGSLIGAGSSAFGIGASYGATSLFANGLGSTLSAGSSMIGAGSTMSGLGTIAGALAPIALGIGAIYTIAKSLDDSGTYHTGGAAQYSAMGGLTSGQSGADYNIGFGRVEAGADSIKAVGGIAQALGTALDGVAVSFGQKAGYEIATAFADDTSKDGAWGALRISKDGQELLNWEDTRQSRWAPREFGDGEEGYKQYLAAVAKDTRTVLLDMDLPSWADKLLTSIDDSTNMESLQAVITQIGVIQTAFVSLGNSMEMFANLTDEMQSSLLTAAGSIDALTAVAGAFYQGFYSEQERMDLAAAQINKALTGMNLSIDPKFGDDAKAQFRSQVEAAFAAGNAELATGLLAISGNFATVADYFEQFSQAAADAATQAASQFLDDLANYIAKLATNASNASNARDTAGSSMDKLAGAAGFQDDGYARIREARLWEQLAAAPWEHQIQLASELTNIVVSRYETEKQAAKEQLEFAKSLRDYLDSLMTGDLSPLTNAEKLSKAQDTYLKTLTAARGGDTDAQGKLQGASSEYLELARNYYASSETYTAIFESVTGALSSLGKAVEVANSDKIGSETLAQMYKLYGVLDSGYQTANAEALKQTSLLVEQLTQLSKVSGGVAKVLEIIAGLPAGTSSQVGNSVLGNIAQQYAGLMSQVGVSTSVADTVTAINSGSTADLKTSYEWSKGIMQTDSQRAALEGIWSAVSQYRGIDGSHADGLAYVPFDGYTAELHKGERVLTAYENRTYSATSQDYDAVVEELQGLREDYARLTGILAEVISSSAAASAEKIVKGTGAAVDKVTHDKAVKSKATVR